MRRTFEYWFNVNFKPPYNKKGLLCIPDGFRQPINERRPLAYLDEKTNELIQTGFRIGLGYCDYKDEKEFKRNRDADSKKKLKKNKKRIKELKEYFEEWKSKRSVGEGEK